MFSCDVCGETDKVANYRLSFGIRFGPDPTSSLDFDACKACEAVLREQFFSLAQHLLEKVLATTGEMTHDQVCDEVTQSDRELLAKWLVSNSIGRSMYGLMDSDTAMALLRELARPCVR